MKNHRFLLRVLAEANRAGRSFTLDVFGEGPLRKDLLQHGPLPGTRRTGSLPRLPARRPRFPARLPGLRPRFVLRIVIAGDHRSDGRWSSHRGRYIGPISELCDDGVEARFWPLDDPAQAAATLIELLDCEPRDYGSDAARERFDATSTRASSPPGCCPSCWDNPRHPRGRCSRGFGAE